jgi:uncharacterized cupin superfamily protein
VEVFNLYGDDWDVEDDRQGYAKRMTGVARRLGGELLGASLYEVPPGQRTWPYHVEHGNEEWLLVVDGAPTLRTPGGERELSRGDAVCFRRGPDGAHQVINRSEAPARLLILSTMQYPHVVDYPDSGKVGIAPERGERLMLNRDAQLDYWERE